MLYGALFGEIPPLSRHIPAKIPPIPTSEHSTSLLTDGMHRLSVKIWLEIDSIDVQITSWNREDDATLLSRLNK
ncbi:MAG: hypothetical protein ACPGWR_12165 [Ardenticatenaceae bacterium]